MTQMEVRAKRIEEFITSSPKLRRFSVGQLQNIFVELCGALKVQGVVECGANDGRHTSTFLRRTGARVWAFEANPMAAHRLLPRCEARLTPVIAALGDGNGPVPFTQPLDQNGVPVDGVSSLSSLADGMTGAWKFEVMSIRFDDYVSSLTDAPATWAAWIDVEGNADRVLEGFGRVLDAVQVALVEVENRRWWDREPSRERVVTALRDAGLEVVGRDWMTVGQHNVLVMRSGLPVPASLV